MVTGRKGIAGGRQEASKQGKQPVPLRWFVLVGPFKSGGNELVFPGNEKWRVTGPSASQGTGK